MAMNKGSAPKGGMQPKQKPAAAGQGAKARKTAAGAPKRGSGADTNPYSSARKG